jgi:UDP-galactose transporter B1
MARSKQPAMKREASSEYFNKKTSSWEDSTKAQAVANGKATNGVAKANGRLADHEVTEEKGAGIVQLVIAVSGIYASLYVEPVV